jgi:hypothetical protein
MYRRSCQQCHCPRVSNNVQAIPPLSPKFCPCLVILTCPGDPASVKHFPKGSANPPKDLPSSVAEGVQPVLKSYSYSGDPANVLHNLTMSGILPMSKRSCLCPEDSPDVWRSYNVWRSCNVGIACLSPGRSRSIFWRSCNVRIARLCPGRSRQCLESCLYSDNPLNVRKNLPMV